MSKQVARRYVLDIELGEDEEDQFFDFLAGAAESASYGGNFDLSAGPAPADACFPHLLRS